MADDAPSEPLPTEWRTEAWHGLQVEVPADWAWGGCADRRLRDGRHSRLTDGAVDCETTPYVGRPVSHRR